MHILMIVHFFISLILVILVLFQRAEGGASLVGGGLERTMEGSSYTVRNPMAKLTMYFVIAFFVSSIALASLMVAKNVMDKGIAKDLTSYSQKKVDQEPSAPMGE